MKNKKYASGQVLSDNHEVSSYSGNKSVEFRAIWSGMVDSPMFLIFALRVTAVLVAGVCVFSRVLNLLLSNIQNNAQNEIMYMLLGVAVVLMVYLLLNAVGVWMIYKDTSNLSKGKSNTPGLLLIMWTNRAMLGLSILAFMAALPYISENIPYDSANDIYLEIAYIVLVLIGLWSAAMMVISQKIWEKLTIWNNGIGPVKAVAVICVLIRIGAVAAMFCGGMDTMTDVIWLPVFAVSGILSAILFVYNKQVSKIQ